MTSRRSRYSWMLGIWMIVMLYIGWKELTKKLNTIEILHQENKRLRRDYTARVAGFANANTRTSEQIQQEINEKNILSEKLSQADDKIRELKNELLEKQREIKSNGQEKSASYERLRRRISNQIKEMGFFISGQLTKKMKVTDNNTKHLLSDVLHDFGELQQITELDYENLIDVEGPKGRKDDTAKKLSDIVQNRLHRLQNPKDCDKAKKIVCSLRIGCGYGCLMHHLVYCLLVSYATKRTLIIDSSGWQYSAKGWNAFFHPISNTCEHFKGNAVNWNKNHENYQTVRLPIIGGMQPRLKQMPLSVPKDLYSDIIKFHGYPFVWWVGQFSKYLFSYQPILKEELKNKKQKLGFLHPIVGIHVRRTDKINTEASFHSIDEYMYWVDLYYKKLVLGKGDVKTKRVFIATDDSSVLPEVRKKYPDYEFLNDNDVSKSARLSSRYSDVSLRGIISDVEILSETDFLVCTFSSQICRLAYEMMNTKHTDASQKFRSLDDVYYFAGQNKHFTNVLWSHKPKNNKEIELKKGDIVHILGNHWDGKSKGISQTSKRTGMYPSYKVEDIHDVVDFPTYDDE